MPSAGDLPRSFAVERSFDIISGALSGLNTTIYGEDDQNSGYHPYVSGIWGRTHDDGGLKVVNVQVGSVALARRSHAEGYVPSGLETGSSAGMTMNRRASSSPSSFPSLGLVNRTFLCSSSRTHPDLLRDSDSK
ncbi:hypothetical protein Tco_0632592 [Tanacetum coccineum]